MRIIYNNRELDVMKLELVVPGQEAVQQIIRQPYAESSLVPLNTGLLVWSGFPTTEQASTVLLTQPVCAYRAGQPTLVD